MCGSFLASLCCSGMNTAVFWGAGVWTEVRDRKSFLMNSSRRYVRELRVTCIIPFGRR